MRGIALFAATCALALGAIGPAGAQTSGTPGSTYPWAAPHEVRDGCLTMLDPNTRTSRVPIDCNGPETTGSIAPPPPGAMMAPAPPPGAYDPYAAPQEMRGGCRTVLDPSSGARVPVDC